MQIKMLLPILTDRLPSLRALYARHSNKYHRQQRANRINHLEAILEKTMEKLLKAILTKDEGMAAKKAPEKKDKRNLRVYVSKTVIFVTVPRMHCEG